MKNKETLILMDWDDTLFPTTWTIKSKINLTDPKIQNKYIVFFSKLDNLLYKIFLKFSKCGNIVIVTHAMTKWVYISSTILPNTQQYIKKNIKVISARDLFQNKISDMVLWKKIIFEKLDQDLKKKSKLRSIISVGDAEYELNALINLFDEESLKKIKI